MDGMDMQDHQKTKKIAIKRESAGIGGIDADVDNNDAGATKKISTKPSHGNKNVSGGVKKRKAPAKKTNYAIFLVTTVFVGIIAAVFTFAMFFNEVFTEDGFSFGGGSGNQPAYTTAPPEEDEEPPILDIPALDGAFAAVGIIQDININSNRLDIYVIAESLMRSFFIEGHSVMRDKFGSAMTFAGFSRGDVVEIEYFEGNTTAETARISAQVFTYPNMHDVVIDTANSQLLIGTQRYSFSPRTVVMYRDEAVDISEISPVDVVSVDTFAGRVVFVDIHRSNGIIHVPQNELIIRGRVEIGTSVFTMLEGDMDISVAEGDHRVTIAGENIEPFYFDVTVTRGGTSTVNFDGLELRQGSVTVNIDDALAILTIDGQNHPTNQPVVLDFGTYELSVEREGYVPFHQEVTISATSATQEINVTLEEMVLTRNVILITSPPGARVYLDGAYVGMSPVGVYLEHRRYAVNLTLPGFVDVNLDIWVTEDTPVFSFPMVPDFSDPPIIFE